MQQSRHARQAAEEDHGAPSACPPQDRGRAAWTSLAAVSATLMITWGFVSAFGVFRSYYFTYAPFAGSQIVTEIGVMSLGFLQILAPLLLRYLSGRMHQRKQMMMTGMVLVVGGSIGAAFSRTPIQVLMSQGLIYSVGSGLVFAPSISFMDEWFLERRGLANGLFFGSNNIAAAAFSPIFSTLLRKFGPRPVLMGWAVFAAVTISCAVFSLQERHRHEAVVDEHPRSHTLFRRPLFWVLGTSIFLQGLANFLPAAYLPSYASDLGVSAGKGAILLTILNIAGMLGLALSGLLIDAVGVRVPLLLSTLASAFAVFVIWGLARAYWVLTIFGIVFGPFSFSFIVLRSHFAVAVVGNADYTNEVTMVSGALLALRGVATVVSGFVGDAVVSAGIAGRVRCGYGLGEWRILIITVGSFMVAASIGVLGLFMCHVVAQGKRSRVESNTNLVAIVDTPSPVK